jgi:lipopolysaccharide export system permease protein
MVIYVPDSTNDRPMTGIFVSDERTTEEPRVIVAEQYQVLMDSAHDQVALRLVNGVIHSRSDQVDRYRQISFSSYDIKLNLNQSNYAAAEERPSYEEIMAKLARTNGKDAGALRRLTEHYRDLAFPTASLVFCLLGVPVGIVSKRSGRIGGFAVGVLIVIAFYVANVACDFLVTKLVIGPFTSAWLPNILFTLITILLFLKMSRE